MIMHGEKNKQYTKQLQRPKLKLLAGRMCAQQILNVGMKTSQTISMGTHMLPKKG